MIYRDGVIHMVWTSSWTGHAHQPVVQGEVRAGRVTDQPVTPVERRADEGVHGAPAPR